MKTTESETQPFTNCKTDLEPSGNPSTPPTDKPFPRWFRSHVSGAIRRFDNDGYGINLPHNVSGFATFGTVLALVRQGDACELTQQEAEEILRGEKR